MQSQDVTLVNIKAPNMEPAKCIRQLLTDRNAIIVGKFKTTFKSMDSSSKQKINRVTVVLTDT